MADVRDPVCGMEFPEEGAEELGACVLVHRGRKLYFCCPTCEAEFRADPARYSP